MGSVLGLNSKLSLFFRKLTRKVRPVYSVLSKMHHRCIRGYERYRIERAYGSVEFVEYSERDVQSFKRSGFRSQFGQDYYLATRSLIPLSRGSFIEVGCNHPENESNSWYLEKTLGYIGLAIDPLKDFATCWKNCRPQTKFLSEFVSSRKTPIQFAEISGQAGWENMLSGSIDSVQTAGKTVDVSVSELVPVALSDILRAEGFDFGVDVLYIDVEGHEECVINSADWTMATPRVLVVENTGAWDRQERLRNQILNLGYIYFARISIFDDVFISRYHPLAKRRLDGGS